MKTTSLIILLIIAAFQLKAQQVFKFKPFDSLLNSKGDYFKIAPVPGLQFTSPGLEWKQTPLLANTSSLFLSKTDGFDHMPITLFIGRDDMLVVKTRGYDRMPVLDLRNGTPVDEPQNVLPTAPTFYTPGGQK